MNRCARRRRSAEQLREPGAPGAGGREAARPDRGLLRRPGGDPGLRELGQAGGPGRAVVRDLARQLKKEINLVMEGEETDLDKNLVEALADPMVHLVRNSCDHGIELPEERVKAGKTPVGTIRLSASQEGDHILLLIEDDGAGMDPEKLKSIAIKRGVLDSEVASRMSDTEAYNLIFAPGFSTKQEISDISRSLKALARELNVPVIAVSQLSRATEQREGYRPRLSDLRDSGAIEQDADVVLLIFREEYYNPTPKNEGLAEVIVAKQRNGPVGTKKLTFLKEFSRFENYTQREE